MNISFELYKKCIRGEGSPQEVSLVENWLRENPTAFEADMLAEVRQMQEEKEIPFAIKQEMEDYFRQRGVPFPAANAGAVEDGSAHAAAGAPVVSLYPERDSLKQGRARSGWRRRWSVWAAAAASVILAIGGWRYLAGKTPERSVMAWETIFNNSSEVKQVLLSDSSKVWLNAFASIRYRGNWQERAVREVELTGEAYFKVQSIPGRPFTVLTNNLQTQVLGTEFNVEAYADESLIKISLVQGKVRVACPKNDRSGDKILMPGQMAIFQKTAGVLSVDKMASDMPQAWIKEGLVLNDVPLSDALKRIGRKYDRKILYDTAGAARYRHLKANYRAISIDQVLLQLGFSCNFNFKKTTNTYIISFKKEHPVR